MPQWSNYTGSLNTPNIEFAEVENIVVVVDKGTPNQKAYGCSSEDVAEQNVSSYTREGRTAVIEKRKETYGYERPW